MTKILSKKKVKVIIFILIFLIIFLTILTKDRQRKLPYRVNGKELLEIKEKCKDLAEAKKTEWNNSGIGYHDLNGYGYSEFRGSCYAEFIRFFDINSPQSKVLYDTTEGKELNTREWTKDLDWYDSDFDHIILGKYRILDFRQPF